MLVSTRNQIDPSDRLRDADQLLQKIKQSTQAPTEEEIAQISEIALQEVFGLAAERDSEVNGNFLKKETVLRWLYGLLCLTEKPLLADQAADLNDLLARLELVRGQTEVSEEVKAMVSLNVALITEYFDQRFR